ncbi:MAG: TonB-dependent receptor domain-containing protein [Paracoccus sp. (in: a-proteobacteria)]
MLKPTSLLLVGASTLAMTAASYAQDLAAPQSGGVIVLDPITLVADGQENVEATGGSVVTEEDIADLQPADVSELFARDSAISVSGGAGPSKRIHVFGLEQSSLAVSVDGVPQFKDNWHHSGSNVIDPAFLKRVEVEAGAAAADAGFGAGAGAVRYETLGARDLLTDGRSQGGRAGLSYGSNGRGLTANLAGYGVYENVDWFVMLHRADGENYENGDGYEVVGSKPAATGALLKTGYEFEGHRVELSYEYNKDSADRVTRMNMDVGRTKEVFPLKVTRNTLSLKYTEVSPTALWDPEVVIYTSRNDYDRPDYIEGAARGDFRMKAETIGGLAQNRFEVGPGSITAGVDWAYDDYRIDNYGDTDVAIRNLETMQVGTFVQGRFAFANGIDISTGARVDHQRFTDWNSERHTDTGASVNGTISYEFAPGYEVFTGASHTWMGYDLGEYGYLHARGSSMVVDPGYEPATARNYKLGLNATQDNWTGNLTLFDTRLKNLANSYYRDSDGSFTLDNTKEYRSRGFTLQGNYSWGSGRVGAGVTRAHVEYDGEDALPSGGDAIPIGTVASLFVDQDIAQYDLRVGGTLELANRLDGDYLTEAGFSDHAGYGVVNAYAEWRPETYKDLVVRLGVDNLFDKNYYERSSYVQYSSRDVQPLYAPGRTVTLGLNMDF